MRVSTTFLSAILFSCVSSAHTASTTRWIRNSATAIPTNYFAGLP